MATPENKVPEPEVNHVEPKEVLTSVTDHEKFSVPDGHEVTVVEHTTNNAEAVVSVSTEQEKVGSGRLVSMANGESAPASADGEGKDGGTVSASPSETASPEVAKVVNSTVPEGLDDGAAGTQHSNDCLVDQTSKLIKVEVNVPEQTATQDSVIIPNQPAVCPTVYRPKRPPPPGQVPSQITPTVAGSVQASQPTNAACASDSNLKTRSLNRFRTFGSSVRKKFNKMKGTMRRKNKDVGQTGTSTREGSIHDGHSVYSTTGVYASQPSSVMNTPVIPRREDRINQAKPDLMLAMQDYPGSSGVATTSQDEVLNWTAKAIAVDASHRRMEGDGAFESAVQPTHVTRISPQLDLLAQMTPEAATRSPESPNSPALGDSRKPPVAPPRSMSEYDHDRTVKEGAAARRPASFWAGLSLDRRKPEHARRQVPLEIRRTQTLRTTDYPARLRDRILRSQGDSIDDSTEPDGYKRRTLKTTVYERSDKISWPPKMLSFRRNRPAKTVLSKSQGPSSARSHTSSHITSEIEPTVAGQVHVERPVLVYKDSPQRVTPPCLPKEASNVSHQGLTSLASYKRVTLLQQMSKGIHDEVRPVIRLVMQSETPVGQAAPLPYFSETLTGKASWIQQDAKVGLRSGVNEVHPFLVAWTELPESGANQEAVEDGSGMEDKTAVTCLQNYLTSCLKLYSVDLQGQFAPFHYPLNDSNVKYWQQCVMIDDCMEVRILREPQWNTEYMELVNLQETNVTKRTLFYANRPIDNLLTAWLDCQRTIRNPASPIGRETSAYHPVQVIAQLSQLLSLGDEKNCLLDSCIRLAVLLTYNYIKSQCQLLNQNVRLNTEAKHIILFMSTTNCLVAFTRQEEKQTNEPTPQPKAAETQDNTDHATASTEEAKSEEKEKAEQKSAPSSPIESPAPEAKQIDPELETLLNSIKCDVCATSEEAIGNVLSEIRKLVTGHLSSSSLAVPLMRAVVPPDWMAMTLARVCIVKE